MARKKPYVQQARVIVDCRNAAKDYFIPLYQAKDLYNAGRLSWDCTNGCYTE